MSDHSEAGSMSAEEKAEVEAQRREDADAVDLLSTTDPAVWASEFIRLFANKRVEGSLVDDEGVVDAELMIGWFANAMQAKETEIEALLRKQSGDDDEAEPERENPNLHKLTTDELHELCFLVAGAASSPFMKAHPDFVMPTEELTAEVNRTLADKGFPIAEQNSPEELQGTDGAPH